jgi:hypothetical protein
MLGHHGRLHVLFSKYNQHDQVMQDEMDRVCSRHGVLVGKSEGKRPLGRSRRN